MPLLIGGATTSRTHTAVKIAPGLRGTAVDPRHRRLEGGRCRVGNLLEADEVRRDGDRSENSREPTTKTCRAHSRSVALRRRVLSHRGGPAPSRTPVSTGRAGSSRTTPAFLEGHDRVLETRMTLSAIGDPILHRLDAVLPRPGKWSDTFPAILMDRQRQGRRSRGRSMTTPRQCPTLCFCASKRRSGCSPKAPSIGIWPANADG